MGAIKVELSNNYRPETSPRGDVRGEGTSHDRRTPAKFSHFEFVNTRNRRLTRYPVSDRGSLADLRVTRIMRYLVLRPLNYIVPAPIWT